MATKGNCQVFASTCLCSICADAMMSTTLTKPGRMLQSIGICGTSTSRSSSQTSMPHAKGGTHQGGKNCRPQGALGVQRASMYEERKRLQISTSPEPSVPRLACRQSAGEKRSNKKEMDREANKTQGH
eukprot:CAMPEP_0180830250 /NCGR_PEP_ID=MMETSP1038_2-20121128/75698_1 /TAXON_ID=632150 /ORGANISM="Azadinium spinosum, Strain 3D9" /LENGTH=127 /DNA_ID=CAMNT_0022873355 /DNA_START=369 /DNA_END=753 /DNA_ORIENTATION=-